MRDWISLFPASLTSLALAFFASSARADLIALADQFGTIESQLRRSETEMIDIATQILLGAPYGLTTREVHRNIVGVSFGKPAPCSDAPAWVVTVHVPANAESNAIDGYLEINDLDGKPVCVGLPFLDEVELSDMPLEALREFDLRSVDALMQTDPDASAKPALVEMPEDLPALLKQIEDRYAMALTLTGAVRSDELASIRILFDQVTNRYPASNEALSLALGGKLGSIDPAVLDVEIASITTAESGREPTAIAEEDRNVKTLSVCFSQSDLPEERGVHPARITIHVELDADGRIIGMPNLIEPATPDAAARKLFQLSLIALDRCDELKTLNLPAAIEMTMTPAGVEKAVLKPGVLRAEEPALKLPSIAAEDPPEVDLEPVWTIADTETDKALDLKLPDIAELQVRLGLLGFDPNGVDGVIGRGLRKAIHDWQTARSVPASGYLDKRQLTAIKAEAQDAFSRWIAEKTNAEVLAKASKPPNVDAKPSSERAQTTKRKKDCISFEGVTTCL